MTREGGGLKIGIFDEELIVLDECFDETESISVKEKSALYYISGYVCRKENLPVQEVPTIDLPESEFTKYVSRGKLCHPPRDLYDLSLYLYAFYSSISDRTCIKRILVAFNLIYESSHCEFTNISSILRRYVNTFSNGFVKKETEKIKVDKKKLNEDKNYSVKRRRLANK